MVHGYRLRSDLNEWDWSSYELTGCPDQKDFDRVLAITFQHFENISPRKHTLYCSETLTVHRDLFLQIAGGRQLRLEQGFSGYSAGRGGESAGDAPRGFSGYSAGRGGESAGDAPRG
ncbi:hypothetical protein F511_17421 [Dorcoceras hygrometricum]|uniref:Uncharacterized protein n=1 Tax=Dorcoceras hygrometricum TaxID=472368 RepID=A0A2Z7CBU0_9LAMI|nr:hypothetical protein F511_17421 [Dorcoceras hygrometricum]